MTWMMTIQMMIFATILSISGLGYCAWLARDFDRRYGRPRRPGPAE